MERDMQAAFHFLVSMSRGCPVPEKWAKPYLNSSCTGTKQTTCRLVQGVSVAYRTHPYLQRTLKPHLFSSLALRYPSLGSIYAGPNYFSSFYVAI